MSLPADDRSAAAEAVDAARRVLRMEAAAIRALEDRLDATFAEAVAAILHTDGRVIVSGVGKSGIIARKIAATLTSTGTPAVFLHPVEALHGDLGIVGRGDVAILLSKSGESEELAGLLHYFGRVGVTVIALTSRLDSALVRQAHVVLDCGVTEEACPHDLTPTCSTTAALAMGDALAVALLLRRGFRKEDFAQFHPGGTLGRRLLVRVRDVMVTDNLPVLSPSATMREAVIMLAERRGTIAVVDEHGVLIGVVTTGDLARLMERDDHFLDVPLRQIMTRTPKVAEPDQLAASAARTMEHGGVMALPVLDAQQRVVGIVHLHDLMRAGAV